MAAVIPDVFTIIQAYGGQKKAYFEVAEATAADTIEFATLNVKGAKLVVMQDAGAAVDSPISGDDLNIVTVGTGPSADKLVGEITFRSY